MASTSHKLWLKFTEQIPARRDVTSLRAVSKNICTIVTPLLIRDIFFQDTLQGLTAWRDLIKIPTISDLVRTVALRIGFRQPTSQWKARSLVVCCF